MLVWIGLLFGGAVACVLVWACLWIRDSRVNPADEVAIALLHAMHGPQLAAERLAAPTEGDELATEGDALLWGFEPDWCAADRLELMRAYWRERA